MPERIEVRTTLSITGQTGQWELRAWCRQGVRADGRYPTRNQGRITRSLSCTWCKGSSSHDWYSKDQAENHLNDRNSCTLLRGVIRKDQLRVDNLYTISQKFRVKPG
ncbi:hypothetical protein PSTG_08363 [Puccinia striiformis f. sp. tritici PST-78]|uniref:Uncharacterized protein n=1 Tax=Puccinia striiformis f. sp. tritici PST-78 TaxID=1165861 RepID=A0A0L0VG60_9BASI|nr:hypothetical protein PSTG_08363 [Puccinia striiformis f. sp. tritici PST-78]